MLILASLIFMRLLWWKMFPNLGTAWQSEFWFCVFCMSVFTIYLALKIRTKLTWVIILFAIAPLFNIGIGTNTALLSFYLMLILYSLIADAKDKGLCVLILVSMAVVSAAFGIWEAVWLRLPHGITSLDRSIQTILLTKRSCSFQGWPLSLAGTLILFIPLACLHTKHYRKWWSVLISAILILGLMSTMSIMSTISLFLATLCLYPRLWWVCVVVLIPAVLLRDLTTFWGVRSEYLVKALGMIKEHPFIGSGYGSFYCPGISGTFFAHNSYLQLWAECGVIAFLASIGLFWIIAWSRPRAQAMVGVKIGLLAFMIDNLFSYTLIKPNVALYFWVLVAIYFSTQERVKGYRYE